MNRDPSPPRSTSTARRRALRALLAAGSTLASSSCGWLAFGRTSPAPPATWRDPFGERFVVVIDAGHGGNDAGTRAADGLLEKDLTLDLSFRLRARLLGIQGVHVVLTREQDVWLSRAERAAAVREADADLLISLHFNDLPQREITLVETYYAHASNIVDSRTRRREGLGVAGVPESIDPDEPSDITFTRGSARFAALVQQHVFAAVVAGNERAIDAGVKRDTLFMLTRAATSGALVEITCLSNAAEAERLRGDAYLDELAVALATAVDAYRQSSNEIEHAPSVR